MKIEWINSNGVTLTFDKKEEGFSEHKVVEEYNKFIQGLNVLRNKIFDDEEQVSIGIILE